MYSVSANLKETPSKTRLPVGEGRRLSYSSPGLQAIRASSRSKSTSPTTTNIASRRGTTRVVGTTSSGIPEYRSSKDVKAPNTPRDGGKDNEVSQLKIIENIKTGNEGLTRLRQKVGLIVLRDLETVADAQAALRALGEEMLEDVGAVQDSFNFVAAGAMLAIVTPLKSEKEWPAATAA